MAPLLNIPFGNASKAKVSDDGGSKDLQKLRRVDLLELLLDQTRENERQSEKITELTDLTERLKAKLDDKDAQIERLKAKLDDKDAQIELLTKQNSTLSSAQDALGQQALRQIEMQAIAAYLEQLEWGSSPGTVTHVAEEEVPDAVEVSAFGEAPAIAGEVPISEGPSEVRGFFALDLPPVSQDESEEAK